MTAGDDRGALPRRPFLGLAVQDDVVRGVWPGSAAEALGIRSGDRIVSVDGGPPDAASIVPANARAGETLTLALTPGGGSAELRTVTLPLDPWPSERTPDATTAYDHVVVDGARLRSIATIPGGGVGSVVLLLPGITAPPIDHAPDVDDPMRRLVVALAAAGIATLRVERRGVGDSEGDAAGATFESELGGYTAALTAFTERHAADRARRFLFGHSLGGVQAPLIAARTPIAGIVAYGTTGLPWTEAWVASVERQVRVLGLAGMAAAQTKRRSHGDDEATFGRSRGFVDGLRDVDVTPSWSQFAGRTLLLHGEHDVVTTLDEQRRIAQCCVAATVESMPGLDHGMTRVADAAAALRDPLGGTIVDDVAHRVARFVTQASKM
ncbi:MAG: alpha/beta fold hydrolase [Myxococcota bacterium]